MRRVSKAAVQCRNFSSNQNPNKRIAMVLSNPATATTTNSPVGFWYSELTHPYFEFTLAGFHVDIFSNDGGECKPDEGSDPRNENGLSQDDLISLGFIHSPKCANLIKNTKKVAEADVNKYDAIVVAGGSAPTFTFEKAHDLQKKVVEFYEKGRIVSSLCHGTCIFRYCKLSNGDYLAKGKTITGFSNEEEDFSDEMAWKANALPKGKHVKPWRIEDELKRIGANFIHVGAFKPFAIRDGLLITGQQQNSGLKAAKKVIKALGASL